MSNTKIEIEIRAKAPSNITEILLRKGAKKNSRIFGAR